MPESELFSQRPNVQPREHCSSDHGICTCLWLQYAASLKTAGLAADGQAGAPGGSITRCAPRVSCLYPSCIQHSQSLWSRAACPEAWYTEGQSWAYDHSLCRARSPGWQVCLAAVCFSPSMSKGSWQNLKSNHVFLVGFWAWLMAQTMKVAG